VLHVSDSCLSPYVFVALLVCDVNVCHTPVATNQHPDQFHDSLQSTNCIEFWQQHKDTYTNCISCTCHHIIPAMSAGIQRFSLAGIICSDRRNRLGDSVFESLLLAKFKKYLCVTSSTSCGFGRFYLHTLDDKMLSCRRETARRSVSLDILLSDSRSLKVLTLLSSACVSPY